MNANASNLLDTLNVQGWLLADGATGTNLFAAGLPTGEAPELWNIVQPRSVASLCKEFVEAGAQLILTNSFGANSARLKLHGRESQSRKIARVAAEIAREVSDSACQNIFVAGSMGPTGELLEPVGSLSKYDAIEIFHEQADGLREGGADFAWIETMSSIEEYEAASEGSHLAGISWCGTMSFDTAARTMMGVSPADFAKTVHAMPYPPLAFGANCGTGASDLVATILEFESQTSRLPIIAKGNAGIPKFLRGQIVYDGSPELMAKYAVLAKNAGARIIGGCCGTTPAHIRAMRLALETAPKTGPRPAMSEIVSQLGQLTANKALPGKSAKRRSGRRRSRKN
ncbi:MAG: betaine--homocysteine S-methyltransferase [Albidovulum sp.]|nr:betaine--homocysteine S-methyltransferase [Albidovulum sp.]